MRPAALQRLGLTGVTLIVSMLIAGTASPSAAQVGVLQQHQLIQATRVSLLLKLAAMSAAQALERERAHGAGKYQLFEWAAAANPQRSPAVEPRSRSSLAQLQLDAHAARAGATTGEFERAMSRRLQDASLSNDDRAYCMLALAYHQEIAAVAKPAPLAGKLWIDRALAVAESDSARHDCIEYLVIRHVWARSVVEAQSIVLGSQAAFATDRSRWATLLSWIDGPAPAGTDR